jgi:glycosyltransferase involved in cell wall biosynthesis
MKNEKITVIIPVYNAEKYLAETLESVISQTYSNLEIVCINDGSKDGSLDIIKKYKKKDKRIFIIDQENSGVIKARNTAILRAKGKYILPLDSDDKISKDCIEKLYNLLNDSNCAVAAPGVKYFGDRNDPFVLPEPSTKNMARQNCIVNCALFDKKYWKKYGGYDERFSKGLEDYDFWWNFLQDGKKISRTKEVLFFYRVHLTGQSRNQRTADYHQQMINIMLKKYPLMQKLNKASFFAKILNRTRHPFKFAKNIIIKFFRLGRLLRWRKYGNYVLNNQLDKTDFIEITKTPYNGKYDKKLIAYYLPQYYQIPQNDEWFGRGFTEWNNTSKASPQFNGHWQPHIPIDVGYYSLDNTYIMHRQIELAKMYGVYGFCFYYYWFSGGSRIMEKPINNWITDKDIDFPFMLFWANEDWTNTWGENADLGTKTYSAKTKPSDIEKFVKDILPFIKQKNYITVDGRPHIIIYQALKDPFLPEFIKGISEHIQMKGIKKPYISLVFPDDNPKKFNPRIYNADAAVEFGVHMKVRPDHIQQPMNNKQVVNHLARLTQFNMKEFIENDKFIYKTDFTLFKSVMTTFDNTARKIYSGAYIFSISPTLYKKWLRKVLYNTKNDYVFLSAWNEWAEGMHLEPDHKYGYAYLQATKETLEDFENK